MAMMASDQPGEAEAARRKLLMHLEVHGAGWADLVDRVDVPSSAVVEHASMERRAERAEAGLREAAATATGALKRAERAERRARVALVALGGVVAGSAAVLAGVLLFRPAAPVAPAVPPQSAAVVQGMGTGPGSPPSRVAGAVQQGQPSGQVGYVGADGAVLRQALAGSGGAARPLPGGAPVVVVGRTQFEGAEWFRVRSEQGEGFLPAEAVGFTGPVQQETPPTPGAKPAR